MSVVLPDNIRETIHDLAPDALVRLFRLVLMDGTEFHLSPYGETSWQGNTYDDLPCHLSEVAQDADGKMSRPKFTFANPGGLFSSRIYNGEMDNSVLTRYRILKADLQADRDFAKVETFRVTRVPNLGNNVATAELRDVLDGHQFKLPARAFYPPEFPHVKLQ
jgi:phage-related protein